MLKDDKDKLEDKQDRLEDSRIGWRTAGEARGQAG
jgi:hypothetical protein